MTSTRKKGKVLHGDAREIVYNVLKYFEEEKSLKRYHPYELSTARAAMATGLSVATIMKIKKEGRLAEQTGTKIQTPSKGNRGLNNTRVPVDDSVLCAIRQIIASMYIHGEIPTVGKILAMAKKDVDFKGSKTTLRRILKEKLGFKFNNCGQSQTVLIERDNMDNTTYHSMEMDKVPTATSRKEDIRKWMQKQNIQFEDFWTKAELLNEIKKHEPEKKTIVNELLIKEESRHEVWLPQHNTSKNFEQHENKIQEVKQERLDQQVNHFAEDKSNIIIQNVM